mmetsp:Transcript_108577/g.187768  ORF Transcript_108577/g.187768 Transcript_108577/m.187768 type:complete len:86 (-) Transcript_108577:1127-1384(-)
MDWARLFLSSGVLIFFFERRLDPPPKTLANFQKISFCGRQAQKLQWPGNERSSLAKKEAPAEPASPPISLLPSPPKLRCISSIGT